MVEIEILRYIRLVPIPLRYVGRRPLHQTQNPSTKMKYVVDQCAEKILYAKE